MLKAIIEALSRKGLTATMCEEFLGMLQTIHGMYNMVSDALSGETQAGPALRKEIHDRDVGVNQAERKIRKQIVQHLSISAGADVPLCLVLMSTTKDLERVGDYIKNLTEIADWMPAPIGTDAVGAELREMLGELDRTFPDVMRVFKESDRELGHKLLENEVAYSDRCDNLIERIIKDGLPAPKAVCYALLARYFKRINAHLSNVVTAIVMPLHKLDFFDEKWTRKPPMPGPDRESE